MKMAGAITITFGDVAENHVGMAKHGEKAASGFTIDTLTKAAALFTEAGATCELMDLVQLGRVAEIPALPRAEPAALLVVRGGVNAILGLGEQGADVLMEEQRTLEVDKRALMRGRVVNKRARHNLCFADEACEPKYEAGQGRVIDFASVRTLQAIRNLLPEYLGDQAERLAAEGNYYYDSNSCGIGFHGDGERRLVVALRLGESIPLHYQWFYRSAPVGQRIVVTPPLQHGDLYVMSDKAVGSDWRRPSVMTLRHAAGAPKFLTTG